MLSMSRRFPTGTLTGRFESLRSRGRSTLLAALAAPEAAPKPALPQLRGKALATHHLALALEACQERGTTKPEAFAALRLLINQFEQGRAPMPTPASPQSLAAPAVTVAPEPSARRSRLLSRAFHGATNQLADWRGGSSQIAS